MIVEIGMLVDQLRAAVAAQQQEKASNQVITPWSLTPFTRKIVTGSLGRRMLFRK